MDQNYLDEIRKLKEQKEAELNNLQEAAKFSIPNFDETEDDEPSEASGETIKFEPVAYESTEQKVSPLVAGSRRARKPTEQEILKKKKMKKIRTICLICAGAFVALVAILAAIFFAIRTANQAKYVYEYWGMGLYIQDGEPEYTFFGNLKTLTGYDEIGQVQKRAEFKDNQCIRETYFNVEGEPLYYYAHEYEGGERILSAYFEGGQIVMSETYTRIDGNQVFAERTYLQEEGRTETAKLLIEDGCLKTRQVYEGQNVASVTSYKGTLITKELFLNADGTQKSRTEYRYDAKTNALLNKTEYNAQDVKSGSTEYHYDSKNRLQKVILKDGNDNRLSSEEYSYGSTANPTLKVIRDASDAMVNQIFYTYDAKDRIIKETCMLADNTVSYSYGYEYNAEGFVIKSFVYNKQNPAIYDEYVLYTRAPDGTVKETRSFTATNIPIEASVFNDAGFLIEHYAFNFAGQKILEQKNQYDSKMRLSMKLEKTYDDTGSLLTHVTEQYDSKGKVSISINENTAENFYEKSLYVYGETGNVLQRTVYGKDGKLLRDEVLDDKGRVAKVSLFENGNRVKYNEYTYDEFDRVSKKMIRDYVILETTIVFYTYDELGVLISTYETDEVQTILNEKQYDAQGNTTVKTTYNPDGTLLNTIEYEYDDQNRVIAEHVYGPDRKIITRTVYYYDILGNQTHIKYGPNGEVLENTYQESDDPGTSTDDPNGNFSASSGTSDSSESSGTTDSGTPSDSESSN